MGVETKQPEGNIIFHCEKCSKRLDSQQTELNEALLHARSLGWIEKMVGIVLCHYCEDCK